MSAQPSKSAVRYYSYARFSSKQQAEGDSLTRQAELRDAWLRKQGVDPEACNKMTDEALSAFTGKNRRDDKAALGGFLQLVRDGQIPRGSHLIVEALDRLSREDVDEALALLLSLTNAGVVVVQLMPLETVYQKPVDMMKLLMAVMELQRGNSESVMKSERVGKAWGRRKDNARAKGAPISRECPAWLRVENEKYTVIPEAAAAVKLIFSLAAEGKGFKLVMRELAKRKVPPFPGLPGWARSTVAKLLASRRAVGEYQPMKGTGGKDRKPDGPPVQNFYPAVITEDEYAAARAAIENRRQSRGPGGKRQRIFAGLLVDARDGAPIYTTDKGAKGGGTKLVNSKAMEGKGGTYATFPLGAFQDAVLAEMDELDAAEVFAEGAASEELKALTNRREDIERRIGEIQAQMRSGDEQLAPLVAVLRDLQGDLDKLAPKIAEAEERNATPLATAHKQFKNVLEAAAKAKDKRAANERLRQAVRRLVSKVYCLFVGRWKTRLAAVRVQFRNDRHRDFLIHHLCKHGPSRREAETDVLSFADADIPGERDLRNPTEAEELERDLIRTMEKATAEKVAAPAEKGAKKVKARKAKSR